MADHGRPGMTAVSRRRGLIALAIALSLVVVGIGYLAWRSGPEPTRSDASGSSSPASTSTQPGLSAAKALKAQSAVRLSVSYSPSRSVGRNRPGLQAELTVTASGLAAGTLEDRTFGKAELAWKGRQLYLKGNNAFWAAQGPHYARDLSAGDRWVAPEKRTGYYMLDNFGLDVSTLTPASLATLVGQVAEDPSARRDDAGSVGGRAATAYTTDDWTVVVASKAPHRVLAIGGSPVGSGPIRGASWSPRSDASPGTAVAAGYRIDAASGDGPDDYKPYVALTPKPASATQASEVPSVVSKASEEATTPGAPSEAAPERKASAEFAVTDLSASVCRSPMCTHTYQVENVGGEAAGATLYSDDPGSQGPRPLGKLAPGETARVSFTHRNLAAGTGRTVRYRIGVWVHAAALYGPDPAVVQRLRDRGLAPDQTTEVTTVEGPYRPTAVKLLDQMTKGTPGADRTTVNTRALTALRRANEQGQLPLLYSIVGSGRLMNPRDLGKVIPAATQIGDIRVMERIAHLLSVDHSARVWYDGPYRVHGKRYQADYIYTGTENGSPVQRAVQVKTVTSYDNLGHAMGEGARQLNGLGGNPGPSGEYTPEKAPPGFERVLLVYLEPSVGPEAYAATRSDLENLLSQKRFRQARENLCRNGRPLVDRIMINNSTDTHQWTDLSELGVRC